MPSESEETASQTDAEETTAPATEQETTAAATQVAVQEPMPGEDAADLTAEELGMIRRAFDRTVVIGDSLTQALIDYELLDASHVFYKRGATLRELGETTDRAIAMYPENVIFFKGLNDVDHESYDSYPAAFAERVDQVLQALPNAKVYVCALLPPSNAVGAAREDLARAPAFDQFLESWCATRPDVTYVELDWMVRQDWYMADGIHFKKPFYAVWLKYLAEILNGQ